MTRAFVAIGSNLDDPLAQARRAIEALKTLPESRLVAVSRLYRTPPMGPPGQPDYINAVVALDTELDAHALLDALQAQEQLQARVRGPERWGPRTLDLDILLYGNEIIASPRLTVPHAGIAERGFFLLPLAELAPSLPIPGHGPVAELLAQVSTAGIEPVATEPA